MALHHDVFSPKSVKRRSCRIHRQSSALARATILMLDKSDADYSPVHMRTTGLSQGWKLAPAFLILLTVAFGYYFVDGPATPDSTTLFNDHSAALQVFTVAEMLLACAIAGTAGSRRHAATTSQLAAIFAPLLWVWGHKSLGDHLFEIGIILLAWAVAARFAHVQMVLRQKDDVNLSHQQQYQRAIDKRDAQLSEAHSSRIRVIATASHEIRQPVHALGMLVERLRVDPRAGLLRSQADEISSVVNTLAHGLELLLDISRLEAGTVLVKSTTFKLNDLIDRIYAENLPAASKKGLRLILDSREMLLVQTDAVLLHGILSNFVSNAIRYTDFGEVTLTCISRGKAEVWIHVVDTGRGIPDSMHENIFREYVRVDPANQSVQGFGLGLAIVRRTAALLGASLEMSSRLGRGSRFSVSVPLSSDPGARVDSISVGVARAAAVTRSLSGLRGLLVDNDIVVLRSMEGMVRSWGCSPVTSVSVADLEVKLEHLSSDEFDFIVADYHLGTGSQTGLDAIRLVRSLSSRFVPATVLTADLNVRVSSLNEADVQVLHKPVLPVRLRAAIEEMFAQGQRRNQDGLSAPGQAPGQLL